MQALERKQPAADARLVADDHQTMTELMQPPQTLCGAWQELESRGIGKVFTIDDDGAIAIEYHDLAAARAD